MKITYILAASEVTSALNVIRSSAFPSADRMSCLVSLFIHHSVYQSNQSEINLFRHKLECVVFNKFKACIDMVQ